MSDINVDPLTIDQLTVNTIRTLSIDGVEAANSGHPGMPMGMADVAYILWTRFLRHNPSNPDWFNRDRFILSAGHGSMLIYSLLHLAGYDLVLAVLRYLSHMHSRSRGSQEVGMTLGIQYTNSDAALCTI